MFSKVLIANRGEIACRIIRTARRMGIKTVGVFSEADARAQHVKRADEAIFIGGSRPSESYLVIENIIAAAKQTGADAIHPGYGFLSENADFADACEQANIVFIGPSAASMRKMGSKAGAKVLMQAHQVPVVPGYTDADQTPSHLHAAADLIGYPMMIKAAHGGGGKGMRIVRHTDEFIANLESCQREAKNAFGRDRVLLERFVQSPRHIEFQIFADAAGNTIHLNERECSAQRRYQKVFEESPSPFLTSELRKKMGAAAVAAAQAINYKNAGTVEFIVGPQGDFYFMEINTRLQVEHPVTEMILGLDLVEWQFRIAAGEILPLKQDDICANGHAIEVRLYAEDPEKNFLPGSGKLSRLKLPDCNAKVRVDAGVIEADSVSIFYDPMIAKLIVHDQDRLHALARLKEALVECEIVGPKSNIDFLERLVRHPSIINGNIDTNYLDRHLDEFLPQIDESPDSIALIGAVVVALLGEEAQSKNVAKTGSEPHSPWAIADAWRHGHIGKRLVCLLWREQRLLIGAHGFAGEYRLDFANQHWSIRDASIGNSVLTMLVDEKPHGLSFTSFADQIKIHDGNIRYAFTKTGAFARKTSNFTQVNRAIAPMPGRIVAIRVSVGQDVEEGQELLVMEAMKMEITLRASCAGKIEKIHFGPGAFVEAEAILIRFEGIL